MNLVVEAGSPQPLNIITHLFI